MKSEGKEEDYLQICVLLYQIPFEEQLHGNANRMYSTSITDNRHSC